MGTIVQDYFAWKQKWEKIRKEVEPLGRVELPTFRLRIECSTN